MTPPPILAVALIGILATALLLLAYYTLVIKCCLPTTTTTTTTSPPRESLSAAAPRGLHDSLIRLIPLIRFRREAGETEHLECSVCLCEFNEGEKLRVIPNCCHAFHIDCIDVWLQNSPNCPLCRLTISSHTLSSIDRILNYSSPASRSPPEAEDFVVIEIQGNDVDAPRLKGRLLHVSSLDDGIRNECFGGVEPVRRSISLDLSGQRRVCSEIREGLEQGKTGESSSSNEGEISVSVSVSVSSSNRGMVRSLFSFGSGRGGSRNASSSLHGVLSNV